MCTRSDSSGPVLIEPRASSRHQRRTRPRKGGRSRACLASTSGSPCRCWSLAPIGRDARAHRPGRGLLDPRDCVEAGMSKTSFRSAAVLAAVRARHLPRAGGWTEVPIYDPTWAISPSWRQTTRSVRPEPAKANQNGATTPHCWAMAPPAIWPSTSPPKRPMR